LPILPVLAETLSAGPCGDLSFICGKRGEPLTKESFGNLFKDACRAAGVPGSAHGVRKSGDTRGQRARDRGAARGDLRMRGRDDGVLYIRAAPTGAVLQPKQSTSWRTLAEHLFPHLRIWVRVVGEKGK